MQEFIAIDFETANPKRVSACALGYAKVQNGEIIETNGHLIKPVGGHAPFQSKIHGIKDEHTCNKPEFGEIFPEIQNIFNYPIIGYSLFDKQVLNALSSHFKLDLSYEYIDACSIAKELLPHLKNHKLKTLAKHFELPSFKHHDASEDAITCARIFLRIQDHVNEELSQPVMEDALVFRGIVMGILADDEVNYKEAYGLLYWLEDHEEIAARYQELYYKAKEALEDDHLDRFEELELKSLLNGVMKTL